jgi:hypothetical protein
VLEPDRPAARERLSQRELLVGRDLDQPRPPGAASAAAEVDEAVAGDTAEDEQVLGPDRGRRRIGAWCNQNSAI